MIKEITLLTLATLYALIRCSQVIDKKSQEGIYIDDYCKRIGVCPEGTHVLCTHYNRNRTTGPLCAVTKNVSMTPEYATLLLGLLNVIRSRSARGKTTGLGNLKLPKAYGMFRLQWDPELSTSAQVWANTCIEGFDMCRATKRFPDPGQLAGLTRFDSDWIPLSARTLFNYTGFSLEKVKYGIHSAIRSWYRTKESVHPDDITDPEYIWPNHLSTNVFLEIVHGRATHAGCGISVFEEFAYGTCGEHELHLIHNVVRVICNLSSRLLATPRKDRVYTTDPPTQVGYTVKCGCPLRYDEDEDYLCYESDRKLPYSCKGKDCAPAVVVLPIFTLENAPPTKLNATLRKNKIRRKGTDEMDLDRLDNTRSKRHNLRGSIFLKPSVFDLPPRKLKTTESSATKLIMKDVIPRRNFSNSRQLISNYLYKRRSANSTKAKIKNNVSDMRIKSQYKFQNTSQINHIHVNSETRAEFRYPTRPKIQDNFSLIGNSNYSNDKLSNIKLMSLLNNLEKEVEHAQLPFDRKYLLDHKIRKIYNIFAEKAFLSNRNLNEHPVKIVNFDNFLENDSLHKYKEQFNSKTRNNFTNLESHKNHVSNEQEITNTDNSMKIVNNFTYKNHEDLLRIRNLRRIRNKEYDKEEERFNLNNSENLFLRQEDDLLPPEKRMFYQNKLNDLVRKFQNDYKSKNKMPFASHTSNMRKVLPTYHELQVKRKRSYTSPDGQICYNC